MEVCNTFITIQWMTIIPELGSMVFLFYSTLRDFRSWENGLESPLFEEQILKKVETQDLNGTKSKSKSTTKTTTKTTKKTTTTTTTTTTTEIEFFEFIKKSNSPPPLLINCSSLLAPNETWKDYKREVTFGTLTCIGLSFFFWISCLYLCTHCCVSHRITFFWAAWINLLFALAWFSGGISTLASFLMQNNLDKEEDHSFCFSKPEVHSKYNKCRTVLCQASSAKLVSFGLSIFSCWLHVLCFIVAIEQHNEERKSKDPKTECGNSNASNPNSPTASEMSATSSCVSVSNSFSKIPSNDRDRQFILPLEWHINNYNYHSSNSFYSNNIINRMELDTLGFQTATAIANLHYISDFPYSSAVSLYTNNENAKENHNLAIGRSNCKDALLNRYDSSNFPKSSMSSSLVRSRSRNSNWDRESSIGLHEPRSRSRKLVRFEGVQFQRDGSEHVQSQQMQGNCSRSKTKNRNAFESDYDNSSESDPTNVSNLNEQEMDCPVTEESSHPTHTHQPDSQDSFDFHGN